MREYSEDMTRFEGDTSNFNVIQCLVQQANTETKEIDEKIDALRKEIEALEAEKKLYEVEYERLHLKLEKETTQWRLNINLDYTATLCNRQTHEDVQIADIKELYTFLHYLLAQND